VEGLDYAVLAQMDLANLGVQMVCVEHNNKDQQKFDDLVIPQGYKLVHKNYENLIYAK